MPIYMLDATSEGEASLGERVADRDSLADTRWIDNPPAGMIMLAPIPFTDPRQELVREWWGFDLHHLDAGGCSFAGHYGGEQLGISAQPELDIHGNPCDLQLQRIFGYLHALEQSLDEPRGPVVVEAKALRDACVQAMKAMPKRHSYGRLPIEANILLRTAGASLQVVSTDGRHKHVVHETSAEVLGPLAITVPPRLVADWLSGLAGEVVLYQSLACQASRIYYDSGGVRDTIKAYGQLALIARDGKSRAWFDTLPADEFPVHVEDDMEMTWGFTCDADELRRALMVVLPTVSKGETRSRLCGINWERNQFGEVRIWSSDTHRLSMYRIGSAVGNRGATDPALSWSVEACKDLLKALGRKPKGNVVVSMGVSTWNCKDELQADSCVAWFDCGDTRIESHRKWCGEIPNPWKVEAMGTKRADFAITTELIDALKGAVKVHHGQGKYDTCNRVTLAQQGMALRVTASNAKAGSFDLTIPIEDAMPYSNRMSMQDATKHLDGKYLLDTLLAMQKADMLQQAGLAIEEHPVPARIQAPDFTCILAGIEPRGRRRSRRS